MPTTPSGMYWDSRGADHAPAVVLLEGYTGQLIGWRDEFCDMLVAQGLRVIRMDNRDIGLSRHEPEGSSYDIADMAEDVLDVIVHAGIKRPTVVGQSMGGLIAQHLALNHPNVVAGLVLFYTTPVIEEIDPEILVAEIVLARTREDAIENFIGGNQATSSPAYHYDEGKQRELAGRMFDRDADQSGIPRQRDAIRRMADLRPRLRELRMPVAVIHGRDDEMIAENGSLLIAQRVPHAELHLYPGMGHEIVRSLWGDFADVISRTALRGATEAMPEASKR